MKNNIFSFATGELSQDAFICWAINWFNDDRKPELQEMARNILVKITGISELNKVDVYRQFSRTVYRNNVKEKNNKIEIKIDVLLVLNDKIPVIIEDKTFTGEHDDQIKRYEEGLIECAKQNEGYLEINGEKYLINQGNIIKVYWKTGFFYDADKHVEADIKINSDDILTLLEPYSQYSDILFDYVEKIKSDSEWCLVHGKYWNYDTDKDDSFWGLNVVRHSVAQHKLMRDIFPEKGWIDDNQKAVVPWRVYNGSSYGRPWTEMWMWGNKFSKGDDFEVFWRIDADNGGPYLSLRLYETKYDKNNKEKCDRHARLYDQMKEIVMNLVNQGRYCFSWEKVNPGNKRNCNEAAVFHYHFGKDVEDIRNNWTDNGEKFVASAQKFYADFIDEAEKQLEYFE